MRSASTTPRWGDEHGKAFRVSLLAVLTMGLPSLAGAQGITEYPISFPNRGGESITAGPDGNLWFTTGPEGTIGRITTAGAVTAYPLPTPDFVPVVIVAGPDGNLWFTEQAVHTHAGKIGRITTGGEITEFPTAGEGYPFGITAGPDGNLWYSDLLGTIARVTPAGVITVVSPAGAVDAGNSIVTGPDGNLWFTGTTSNTIGRITPAGSVSTFPVPTASAQPNNIAAGPDGNLWFTEIIGRIGRITTSGVITEYSVPTPNSFTDGISAGPDGNVWFTEYSSGSGFDDGRRIGRVTPQGEVTEIELPTPACGPTAIATGPDRNLWTLESASGKIARITPTGPCGADDKALCLGGGRFEVRAHWTSSSRGGSGDGTAVPLTADGGYFWFFDSSNIEVFVKVLNACSVGEGRFWVFAGGLTNVGVTLTVTDSLTLVTNAYTNTDGARFQAVQDTAAFTCP